MTITLITPTPPDVAAFGIRALSAYLKSNGKRVRVIFLPGGVKKFKHRKSYIYRYGNRILKEIIDLCRDSDLIGVSFMTNYFDRAVQITGALQEALYCPIVWGGIHPTVAPDECLNYVDMVCLGEGEEALLELVEKIERGDNYYDTENFWFKQNGRIIRNTLRPLNQNLDSFPQYDFGLDEHYLFDQLEDRIIPMEKDLLKRCFPLEPNLEGTFSDSYSKTRSYKTMTTRGCPHRCTFCVERTLAELYEGQTYFRKRSIGHIMNELESVKRQMPFVESIFLFDDTFTARPESEIIQFADEYRRRIGLPFHIQTSPLTLNKNKLDALVEGGLAFVEMGIQSVSKVGMDIYKRRMSQDILREKISLIHTYRGRIHPPCYHVILDNPWETTKDVIETLNFILSIPAPFWLKRSSLVCFPGTNVYRKAKEDGIIKTKDDEKREIYNKHLHNPKSSYINFLMYLAGFSHLPRWIIKLQINRFLLFLFDRSIFNRPYGLLIRAGNLMIIISKGIRSIMLGDFKRIVKFLKRWYA